MSACNCQFRLLSSTKASDIIPVNKYVSEKTGLTVIIAGVEGPLVNGFFVLATEANDDDGLPHTLEHLIFLGSERYPYKGILDMVANRCMAQGTNAWTDTDHTCYTAYTAGDAGMLTLLPVYLDHILRPTLSDQGFITEVHHIDGDGEDAGVVYCEMQGRENTADSRCDLQLARALYPGSGYSAETGGIMENIRYSTDNTKVKNFHRNFYRPENLTIILTGQIDAKDVFKALQVVENDVIAKTEAMRLDYFIKPWQEIPPNPEYGDYYVQWPADTEDCGQVSYNLIENIAPLIKIVLNNVPVDKLILARDEALECLKQVRDGDERLDMNRLKRLIRKQLRESIASLESNPHHSVAFRCIGDALYSQDDDDFIARMNPQQDLLMLMGEKAKYWMVLLESYFTDDVAVVIGSPSIELQILMADDEKSRLEDQREELGEYGLAEKAKQLREAMAFNERPPPPGTLAAIPVPPCGSLKCHNISTWSTDGANCPYFDLKTMPLYTRVHSLKTNFVYINLIFDMSSVDQATRQWLPLHLNGLAECPVRRGNTLIPHEEVISTNEQLTVSFSSHIGFDRSGNFSVGQFGNFVHMEVMCETNDYVAVVDHLYEILYAVELTKERLLVFAQRLVNDAAQVRRSGDKMMYDILRDSMYSVDSNVRWCTVLRQQKFLKDLIKRLNTGGFLAETVLVEAKRTFANITKNCWLHLAADFDRYRLMTNPWKKFGRPNEIAPKPPKLYWDADLMSELGGGFVVGVGGWQSCCVAQMALGPLAHRCADVAPLMVALNYFTQLEGPMWRLIRGCGLSYGFGIHLSPNEGRLIFSLYKASNAVQAYTKAKSILGEYLREGIFDKDLFASAKSTALFDVVNQEECPADVVHRSLINYLQHEGATYNRDLVRAISTCTEAETHAAAVKWLPALFDTDVSKLAVACDPAKVNDIRAAFENINIQLESFESMEVSHFNK